MIRARTATVLAVGLLTLAGCSTAATPTGSPAPTTVAATSTPAAVATPVRLLDPADFESQSAGRTLINVHIPDEGALPATDLTLPYDQIDQRAADLPAEKSTPLAIYCMSGNMSAIAGRELGQLGYTDIIELDGGMMAWQATGRPLLPAAG